MEIEDLPEEMQENIIALKHGSATIEADILQVLDQAESEMEFKGNVEDIMGALKQEIDSTIELFC